MGLLRSILEWEIDFKTKNFVYRKDILISFRLFDQAYAALHTSPVIWCYLPAESVDLCIYEFRDFESASI